MTLVDLAGGMGEYVPDALSPAAFIGSALNLIGAGSAAQIKFLSNMVIPPNRTVG